MDKIDIIRSGIFGVVVGDTLGVPVEFSSRAERRADPVTDMTVYRGSGARLSLRRSG